MQLRIHGREVLSNPMLFSLRRSNDWNRNIDTRAGKAVFRTLASYTSGPKG
jgi:hypothetical protein